MNQQTGNYFLDLTIYQEMIPVLEYILYLLSTLHYIVHIHVHVWGELANPLTHHPSSQGCASLCFKCVVTLGVGVEVHSLFCLYGLPFFPSYLYVS